MKESISYSFLLNIVIVFVFVCFAIVMGVLSYYRAFRANETIIESIEKYEGYNCASQNEIAQKLNTLGYATPFNVTCDGKDQPCTTDINNTYAVISYNLDGPVAEDKDNKYIKDEKITSMATKKTDENGNETDSVIMGIFANGDEMNSIASTDENYRRVATKHYQYGVYTYMYVDLPVVSGMLKIPFYSRTNIMYEFRDLSAFGNVLSDKVYDTRMIPTNENGIEMSVMEITAQISTDYANASTGKAPYFSNVNSNGYDARRRAQFDADGNGIIDGLDSGVISGWYNSFYSKYGTCNQIKTFENY